MNGKIIYTCHDHDKGESKIFTTLGSSGVGTLKVVKNPANSYCKFGVAITPSSCYELSLMQKSERQKLLNNIYSKDGLGLSIARLCIGSSDYSAEIYSYDDVENDTELKFFSVERDEEYVIPIIKEILEINPDLYIFASPWSPPFWMKTGGSMYGGYMRDKFLDCYAEYIIKFIKAYEKHGIKVSAITPQNEPETHQNGRMPACLWHPETEAEFIKILRNKLNGYKMNVKIWMHDHNFNGVNRVMWLLENSDGLKDACDGVGFHYYDGAIEQTTVISEKYPDLELNFTEGGPRLSDNYSLDWCKWGTMIIKALNSGYKSFTGWNLILDEGGGPNVGPFMRTCGGFVTHDHRTDEIILSGQYKAFSHIVPYIKPDSAIYPVLPDSSFEMNMSGYPNFSCKIEGTVIENNDGSTIAVFVNPNCGNVQTQIELCGKMWYVELQGDSISTVIIEA